MSVATARASTTEPPRSAGPSRSAEAPRSAGVRPSVIYFSSVSGNTKRFVEKLDVTIQGRIPLHRQDAPLTASEPFVLVLPTYGAGHGEGAVPKQVIRFLNDPHNRALLRGVVAAGNTNFGTWYGIAGDIVAAKCRVPVIDRVEVFGTADDVERVQERMERLWQQ